MPEKIKPAREAQITVSKDECAQIVQLCDVAVRAGGIQNAAAVLPLATKFQTLFNRLDSADKPKEVSKSEPLKK
jgi:hypothetical protein